MFSYNWQGFPVICVFNMSQDAFQRTHAMRKFYYKLKGNSKTLLIDSHCFQAP